MKRVIILIISLGAFAFTASAAKVGGVKPVHPVNLAPAAQPSGHPKTAPKKPPAAHARPLHPNIAKVLPDIVVEKIWLDARNIIHFTLKNKGKGALSKAAHARGSVRVSFGNSSKTFDFKTVDPKHVLAKPGGVISFNTNFSLAQVNSVGVKITFTGRVSEVKGRNNILSVKLKPKLSPKTVQVKPKKPVRKVSAARTGHKANPELFVEKIYLKNGKIHLLIKNKGHGKISSRDYRRGKMVLQFSGKTRSWHIKDVDTMHHLDRCGGEVVFNTNLRPKPKPAPGGAPKVSFYDFRDIKIAPMKPVISFLPLAQVEKPKFALYDLKVNSISKSQLNNYLSITYSSGNPDKQVVDSPITFDVRVTSFYRPDHTSGIKDVELVNRRFTLGRKVVFLDVPITWPYYLIGIFVQVTINPDRSIPETNYENNTSSVYLWEKDTPCVKLLPWPGNGLAENIFFCRGWWGGVGGGSDWGTISLHESEVRTYIERGVFTYLPGGAHGEQDMLIVPLKVAIGQCSEQSNEARYFMSYTTYDGPRTIEGSISLPIGEEVLNISLLLKIQNENLFTFRLENGRGTHGIYFRFIGLPWNLY